MSSNRIAHFLNGLDLDMVIPGAKPKGRKKPDADSIARGKAFGQAVDAVGLLASEVADILQVNDARISQLRSGVSFPATLADITPVALAVGAQPAAMLAGKYDPHPFWFDIRKTKLHVKLGELQDDTAFRRKLVQAVDMIYSARRASLLHQDG